MPYQHTQDPNLRNLHYAMEYLDGKPAIRVSGGGGGGSSGPTEVTGSVSITDTVLAPDAATETTLEQVKEAILAQTAIASTLWTDDSGAYYVRKDVVDQATGSVTVTFTDPTGSPATPGTGLKPATQDAGTQTETAYFTAPNSGVGYNANDILARLIVLNVTVSPATIKTTAWLNLTQGTVLSTPPNSVDQVKMTDNVAITAALPAGSNKVGKVDIDNWPSTQAVTAASLPLPSGAATEATLSSLITAVNSPIPVGTNAIGSVSVSNLPATQAISATSLPLPSGAATNTTLVEVRDALVTPNYSYAYTYDSSDNIQTETRTLGLVSETRTYTWTSGNLTGKSAWA